MGNESGQADVEITPEMIEAGFKVLKEAALADDLLLADKCTVAEIFRAMVAVMSAASDRQRIP